MQGALMSAPRPWSKFKKHLASRNGNGTTRISLISECHAKKKSNKPSKLRLRRRIERLRRQDEDLWCRHQGCILSEVNHMIRDATAVEARTTSWMNAPRETHQSIYGSRTLVSLSFRKFIFPMDDDESALTAATEGTLKALHTPKFQPHKCLLLPPE